MGQINFPATSQMIEQLDSLSSQAADEVTRRIYENHPGLYQRFGEKGKSTCREDLLHHLDYLSSALYAGDSTPFREYVLWLSGVLESRGVPSAHLKESLLLLNEFFGSHLPADRLGPLTAVLQNGVDALVTPLPVSPRFHRLLPEPMMESRDYLQALLSGNRPAALNTVLKALCPPITLVDAGVSIIQPAMYEIGTLWEYNHITTAEEHMATAITQNVMAQTFATAEFAEPLDRKALFACIPGNHHSLGLRMVSDAFEVSGWTVQFLGADVPASDLITQISHWQPELVGLSLSLPGHIKVTRTIIEQLRAELGTSCPTILVGGLATNQADKLWKAVNADIWAADARDAMKEVK
ncbi:MAG: cobalamin-dependent protein [Sulfuricella denitrificans]|nr:cobalamin-dependent protein [Sulfuricella denitrificans]